MKKIFNGESEFSMKLKYLSKTQVDWLHRKLKTVGFIIPITAVLLINFDGWLGYKLMKAPYPFRHKEWVKK
jgi:hypothetical protein